MPCLPLGNLNKVHHKNPLTEGETIELLFQGLTVLEHLHSRGVAYRDLKPENILVERRSPLYLQFTDFGLANDQPDLKTFCGTEEYSAPEIYTGGNYTTAVDIWSLGVIVLEYMYGLPTQHLQARINGEAALRERGLAWCRRLIEHVNDWDSDPLIDLLITGMLRMKAQERLSARTCLTRAYELGLFNELSISSGGATPTQPTTLASEVRNEEETPTVIVGALWDAGRERSNSGGNGQAGRSASDHHSTFLSSPQFGVSRSLNDQRGLRKGTSEAVSDRLNGRLRSSLELLCPPEARSMYTRSKRYRSPAVSSASNSSDKGRVKRRPPEAHLTQLRASRTSKIPATDNVDSEKSLVGRKPEESPFMEVINRSRPVLVRRSDWRVNSAHVANQVGNRYAAAKLRQTLASDWYNIVRGGSKYQGTYVDFDVGINWCRELGLNDLADRLLHLKRVTSERAAGVQQDPIASPVLEDPAGLPHAVLVSSRSANSDPVRAPAMAGRSCSKGPSKPNSSVDAGDGESSKGGIFSEESGLSIETDAAPLHSPVPKESNNAVSLRQSNDEARKNHPQYTKAILRGENPHTIPIRILNLGIHGYRR
ncbi:MAG: hypothetical protein Q9217_006279 [Psora testacea]